MNKDVIKGVAILIGVVLVLAVGLLLLTDNGPQKLSCIGRAIVHGVALSNIQSVCGM
jgi:hypothetical protein